VNDEDMLMEPADERTAVPPTPDHPHARETREDGLADEPGAPLGDFWLVREVGRGGMGVVYEAEQVSLQRRVALKVLPLAATLDSRQRQRFLNEAQAAAHLHHAHIVPVFAVGCERGVHYYAMQFIEGHNLAVVIDQLRRRAGLPGDAGRIAGQWAAPPPDEALRAGPPIPRPADTDAAAVTPRTAMLSSERSHRSLAYIRLAAELGVQAAEALDHAHQQGVLHRDIKPANLLIQGEPGAVGGEAGASATAVHLWITDFGLARLHGETGLTTTGEVVGTLRYMSPEQALGKPGQVGHRTDIYSLGATLYELLTLEPVVAGRDTQELLRQLLLAEPQSPRRINPAIPVELETIVLKALAKRPADRYATAQELADDLRRFLDDQPIRARRPSVGERVARWSRRHKPVVAAAVAGLLIAVTALAITTASVYREKEEAAAERDRARREAAGAQQARDRARRESRRAEAQKRRALTAQRSETRERARAMDNLWLALQAVDAIYIAGPAARLPREPGTNPLDRARLRKALAFYQAFARQNSTDPAFRAKMADAYHNVGHIHSDLGEYGQADAAFARAIALSTALARAYPQEPRYKQALADGHSARGVVLDLARRDREAEGAHRRALAIRRRLVTRFPQSAEFRSRLGGTLHNLAMILTDRGQWAQACRYLEEALSHQEAALKVDPHNWTYRTYLCNHLDLLSRALHHQNKLAETEKADRRSITVSDALFREQPESVTAWSHLARGHSNLAEVLRATGRLKEARVEMQEALRLRRRLVTSFPNVPGHRWELARSYLGAALLYRDVRQPTQAETAVRQGVEHLQLLVKQFPEVPTYRRDRSTALGILAEILGAAGQPPEGQSEKAYLHDLAIYERLAREFPTVPDYRVKVAATLHSLAVFHKENRHLQDALAALRRGRDLIAQVTRDFPDVPDYRSRLATYCFNLGHLLRDTGRPREALASYEKAQGVWQELVTAYPEVPAYRRGLARAINDVGLMLTQTKDPAGAEAAFRRAIKMQRQLAAAFPQEADYPSDLGGTLNNLARRLLDHGKLTTARQLFEEAIQLQQAALLLTPGHRQAREFLGKHYQGLIQTLVQLKDHRALARVATQTANFRPKEWSDALGAARLVVHCLTLAQQDAQLTAEDHQSLVKVYRDEGRHLVALAVERGGADPRALNNLAWALTNEPEPLIRDPARAVELARRVVTRTPKEGRYWNTLGVALYYAGRPREAITALHKSLELREGGDGFDWFFLAMAYQKLGKEGPARQWYQKAVAWMDRKENQGRVNAELRRFRAEAAALLKEPKSKGEHR
jgi:serine/threonine protein kinase/Tfp pilus assembly protein PilF